MKSVKKRRVLCRFQTNIAIFIKVADIFISSEPAIPEINVV